MPQRYDHRELRDLQNETVVVTGAAATAIVVQRRPVAESSVGQSRLPRGSTHSRLESGGRPKRSSMVVRIETVSYWVWSTAARRGSRSESRMAGMRVPGPQMSETPGAVGGGTWSHCPPNSS